MHAGDHSRIELLNIVMAAHIQQLLEKDELDGLHKYWPDWLIKHKGWLKRYLKMRKYPVESKRILDAINEDVLYQKAKERELSLTIVALELQKVWMESGVPLPSFTVNKNLLKGGRAHIGMQMLMLKNDDKEKYAAKKQLVNNSCESARELWGAFNRHILNGEYPYKTK